VLISDADVGPGRDYLRTVASELVSGADLVHCIPVGAEQLRLGAALESLQLNCFVAATLCASELIGHHCVVGKSMLFRRSDLARVGGFESVRDVLAEDYVLGQKFRRAGFSVRLSRYRLHVVQPRRTVRSFCERHLRWAQMRRWVSLPAFIAEAFGNPMGWLLLWLPSVLSTVPAGQRRYWLLLALVILCGKLGSDAVLFRIVSGRTVRPWQLLCVPLKDVLLACVWLAALFDRRVNWRGNALWIGPGSTIWKRADHDTRAVDVLRV
jgi:ceramide glucosyltransferase